MKSIRNNLSILPLPLLNELEAIAQEYEDKGEPLILFGSFARGEARSNSDLDIAYNGKTMAAKDIGTLNNQFEELPTIRSVDLVDIQYASDPLL